MGNGKILIVDDSTFMRMSLKDILTKAGYEIVGEAENKQNAIEKYKELNPDLVTMDVIMPGEDGIEALKDIIKINSKARVIMVTAVGQEASVVEAMSSGAKGFITKPFKPEEVLKEVKKILK